MGDEEAEAEQYSHGQDDATLAWAGRQRDLRCSRFLKWFVCVVIHVLGHVVESEDNLPELLCSIQGTQGIELQLLVLAESTLTHLTNSSRRLLVLISFLSRNITRNSVSEVEHGGPTEGISVYLRVTGKGTVNSEGNSEWSQCCPTRAYKWEERGRDTSSTRKHSLETLQRERHLPVTLTF